MYATLNDDNFAARCLCSRCFRDSMWVVGETPITTPSDQKNHRVTYIVFKQTKKYYEISTIFECIELNSTLHM